jgi:hypothetical protein
MGVKRLTRAQFLRVSGGALLATRFPASIAAADEVEARVATVIADYDRQGTHRTGTTVDAASARWLAEQAREAGAAVTLEPFELDRIDVLTASAESGGRRIDGLPFYDGGFTDARGASGPIGAPAANPAIALIRLNAAAVSSEGRSIAALRRSTTIRAIVAITDGAHPGLTPSNAIDFKAPYGVPVLQVSSEDSAWLDELALAGRDVTVIAHVMRTRVSADTVVANIRGTDASLSPVVVMTPRSGWWMCASERGGGLASWLEIIRAVAARRARRPLLLVASSGHELGHFGLDTFLARRPGLITKAAAWVHLGANIGAAGGSARLHASADEIAALADAALLRTQARGAEHVARGTVPAGEARNIHVGGGRYVSLLGGGPFFHSREDRWPAAVDVPAVAQFARAFSDLTTTLVSL